MSTLILAAQGQGAGGGMGMIIMLIAMFVIMWLFMIRPQQKEAKKKNAMLSELAIGDTVLTTSGFYGMVIDIDEDTLIVEFGNNRNCRIPMQREAVAAVEKPEEAAAGSPAWMATFSDLMNLLLCFFILLINRLRILNRLIE